MKTTDSQAPGRRVRVLTTDTADDSVSRYALNVESSALPPLSANMTTTAAPLRPLLGATGRRVSVLVALIVAVARQPLGLEDRAISVAFSPGQYDDDRSAVTRTAASTRSV